MLVEGDLLITNTKNARICYMKTCLWPKSANGIVEVPYVISSDFCKWMPSRHFKKFSYALTLYVLKGK